MTDKEFVLSVYPKAYFTRGRIYVSPEYKFVLWEDVYGRWAREWNDSYAINKGWEELAELLRHEMLRKLES